jgi:hypothetical protein
MSFLRPRLVDITRPSQSAGFGASSTYGAIDDETETTVLSELPANISWARTGQQRNTGLPGSAMWRAIFRVVFKAPSGTVRERDIITDEFGNRYQVVAAQSGPFGYMCLTEQLHA